MKTTILHFDNGVILHLHGRDERQQKEPRRAPERTTTADKAPEYPRSLGRWKCRARVSDTRPIGRIV